MKTRDYSEMRSSTEPGRMTSGAPTAHVRQGDRQATARRGSTEGGTGCDSKKAPRKTKWLLLAGIGLAIAAAVLGSIWLGMAAVLPFLYLAPLLLCFAMCMKGGKCSASSETDKQ